MSQESPCTCSLSLLGPPRHVYLFEWSIYSWRVGLFWVGFWILMDFALVLVSKEPRNPVPLKDFIFAASCGNFSSYIWINRKTVAEKGQTESHRFYLQQPVAALAPLFFADPVGEIPERFEFLSARELLREFGWETTRPRTIVFLFFWWVGNEFRWRLEPWLESFVPKEVGDPKSPTGFILRRASGRPWWWCHGQLRWIFSNQGSQWLESLQGLEWNPSTFGHPIPPQPLEIPPSLGSVGWGFNRAWFQNKTIMGTDSRVVFFVLFCW